MTNQPTTLKDYAIRMRTLVEGQMQYAADLRELAKEMRETGFQAAVLKAWVKAIISFDDGDEKPLEALKARTAEVALYGDILGFAVEGFGETNRIVVKESPQGDGDGGVEGHAGFCAERMSGGRGQSSFPDQSGEDSGIGILTADSRAGIEPGLSPTIPETNETTKSPEGDRDGGVEGHAVLSQSGDARLAYKSPAAGVEPGPSPTPEKAAPAFVGSPVSSGPHPASEDDPHGNTGWAGAAPLTTDLPGTVATSPGADSDGMALQDGPVPLPEPTLDGEGAGEVDPFHIPDFLRRYPVATQV